MSDNFREPIYYLLTALIAGCVLIIFVIFPGINDDKPSMFGDMIYGKASKPYVYRVLLPATVRVSQRQFLKHLGISSRIKSMSAFR